MLAGEKYAQHSLLTAKLVNLEGTLDRFAIGDLIKLDHLEVDFFVRERSCSCLAVPAVGFAKDHYMVVLDVAVHNPRVLGQRRFDRVLAWLAEGSPRGRSRSRHSP